MTEKIFPRDCTDKCPHFQTWDMSVDDWTCICDLLGVQIDVCDMNYQFMHCPLKDDETEQRSNSIQSERETGMTDREKVIKGLEGIYRCVSPVNHTCGDCPYQDNHVECKRRALSDAIALLKEQEDLKQKMWNALYAEEDKLEKKLIGTEEHNDWFVVYRPWLQRGFEIAIKVIAKQDGM